MLGLFHNNKKTRNCLLDNSVSINLICWLHNDDVLFMFDTLYIACRKKIVMNLVGKAVGKALLYFRK